MEPIFPMPDPEPGYTPFGRDVDQLLQLVEESHARSRRLNDLLATVAQIKARTESVLAEQCQELAALRGQLKERDHAARTAETRFAMLYAMLVHLVHVCELVRDENGWGAQPSEFNDRITKARELVASARPYVK